MISRNDLGNVILSFERETSREPFISKELLKSNSVPVGYSSLMFSIHAFTSSKSQSFGAATGVVIRDGMYNLFFRLDINETASYLVHLNSRVES
ncbi:hypothetical protein DFA_02816 [Cavenderia fasciculata]|uniref:Uncharacterized protein n=1 Tax=Cavenderia fasciculata TaxID=261658 RepID=F4PIJ3_CACFS|nr:uncharacterized protein DFA_02816 [Cavenderia fasciculata]EGG24573.1 hypothetical protein DFA_02816 [Cavenderia fasciculata]|eukprot:XP_004362424.1 hypothetical protein DFA_02816 [Cavenderia fasciculata]